MFTRATMIRVFLLFLLASMLIASPLLGQSKSLRWKLRPGEALHVSFDQDTAMQTSILGKELQSSADMTMILQWRVNQVATDGTMQIAQSIDRLTLTMESPGGDPITFDSATDETAADPISRQLATSIRPLVGVEFVQRMSDRGEIVDVTLSEEARASLAQAPSGAQLTAIFSKEGLKSLLHQAATVLPEKPVTPGDSWNGQTETQSPAGKLVMDMVYTYRGTQVVQGRPLERIDVAVTVRFGDGPNALGLNVEVKEQQNSGAMFFDAEAGRFVHTNLNQNMTLETAIGDKIHRQVLTTKLQMKFDSVPQTASRASASAAGHQPQGASPRL